MNLQLNAQIHFRGAGYFRDANVQRVPQYDYFPFAQAPQTVSTLVIKGVGDPMTLVEPVRQAVVRLDPEVPFFGTRTLQDRIDGSLLDLPSRDLIRKVSATRER